MLEKNAFGASRLRLALRLAYPTTSAADTEVVVGNDVEVIDVAAKPRRRGISCFRRIVRNPYPCRLTKIVAYLNQNFRIPQASKIDYEIPKFCFPQCILQSHIAKALDLESKLSPLP